VIKVVGVPVVMVTVAGVVEGVGVVVSVVFVVVSMVVFVVVSMVVSVVVSMVVVVVVSDD
jgi:hypothetical protein